MCKLGVISQERFEDRESYMPRQLLAEQRMTLIDLEWPFHASRAISAVAKLLL